MKQRSTLLTALVVLLAGCVAGVVANYTVYGLEWVKPPEVLTNEGIKGPRASSADASAGGGAIDQPKQDPCDPKPGDKPMTVRKECVLEFLEQGGAFIVDAREDHEYSVSHFKVAIHIPASDAYNQVGKLMEAGAQVNDPIIVYCGGGDCEASHNVATALRENDFQRVYIYENGWKEVEASGEFGAFVEMGSAN